MTHQRYKESKPSGIEWIGEIPSHWVLKRFKYFSTLKNGYAFKSENYVDNGVPIIRIGDINSPIDFLETKKVTTEEAKRLQEFLISKGDILVALTGATIGKSCVYSVDDLALLNQRVGLIRPSGKATTAFLAYLVSTALFRVYIDFECIGGAQENIGKEQLGGFVFPLPPQKEQQAIASYLDQKTSQIDETIRKKQRLIELLQEERTVLINQAVTKGLEPQAPMKDSGVQWLDKIPQNWCTNKFSRLAFFQEGPGLRNWQFTDHGIKVVCVTNITEAGIDFELLQRCISIEEYESTYKHFTVQKGDYLLSSSGASWGKVAEYTSDENVILNTSTIRFNTSDPKRFDKRFLKWVLKSKYVQEQLTLLMTGSCQPNFGPTHLSRLQIVYPSDIAEQSKIVKFIEERTLQIETIINKETKSISLLQEYRKALITEVVIGKISILSEEELEKLTKDQELVS